MPRAVTRPRVVSVVASVGVVVCQPLPALSLPAAFPLPLFHPRPDRPNRPLSPCLPPSRPKSTPPHPTPSLIPSLFSILLPSFRPSILPSFRPSILPSFHPSSFPSPQRYYMFGDGSAKHFFCGACGVHTFCAPQYADGGEGDGGGDGPVQVRARIRVAS